jgi:CDP-glucose 4,6-dehydratase
MTKIEFWKGRNVLITGINGFIGGNLAKILCNFGANIVGIIRNQNKKSFIYYEGIADKVNLVNGNVTDKELIKRVISEERISVVFHLAAQVEVGIAQVYPYLTWETNIKGTYALLEAIRENSVAIKAAVIASTDKAYGSYEEDKLPYREEYPLVPDYPYDVSKACADMIAKSYTSGLYSLPIIITRFCNIYGPGQLNFSALIPDAIRAALGHGKFIPRSNGLSVRDYIFIDDVIHLYMLFAEKLAINKNLRGEIFNAGTNKPMRVKEIVERIYILINKEKEYRKINGMWSKHQTTGEINFQFMNYDKLNRYFGWNPSIDFEAGLKQTIEWYNEYFRRKF